MFKQSTLFVPIAIYNGPTYDNHHLIWT